MMVAMVRPPIPYWLMMPATITMKAPVGPPIRKRVPPKAEMMKPAMMAVISPCCGVTPLAIPNAMASGRAMIPTMIPAMRSERKVAPSYFFLRRIERSFG